MVGVDIVDVEVGRLGSWLARRGRGVEGNAGAAGEAGDRQAAVADEVIGRRDSPASAALMAALVTCGRTASKVAPFRSRATRTGILS